MKKLLVRGRNKLAAAKSILLVNMFLIVTPAMAALPDTAGPSNAVADGDYIGLMTGYAYDIMIAFGLVLGTVAFLVVGKNMIGIYGEIGDGRKKWGDMGMHGGMGVLLLVFVVYLFTEAATIIF